MRLTRKQEKHLATVKDNREKEEKILFMQFKDRHPLEEGEWLANVTIQDGLFKKTIVVEIKNNNGEVIYKKYPYKKVKKEMEKLEKKKSRQLRETTNIAWYYDMFAKRMLISEFESLEELKKYQGQAKIIKDDEQERIFEVPDSLKDDLKKSEEKLNKVGATIISDNRVRVVKAELFKSKNRLDLATDLLLEVVKVRNVFEKICNETRYNMFTEKQIAKIKEVTDNLRKYAEENGIKLDVKLEIPTVKELMDLKEKDIFIEIYKQTTLEYLGEELDKTKKQKKDSIFRRLPIGEKLKIAYNDSALLRLLGDNYVLGENQKRIKTQEEQEQKRVAKEICKKIENKEEISQEEMIIYLSSLNGYNKNDLRRSIQFDATPTIENLNRLEISFPDSRLLIEEVKTDYQTYLAIEHAIKEDISSATTILQEYAKSILKKEESFGLSYLNHSQEPSERTVFFEEKFTLIDTVVSYLLDISKEQGEDIEESLVQTLRIKEEIKSIRNLITTSEVLTFQILTKDQANAEEMREIVDNYLNAQELITKDSSNPTYKKLTEYVEEQCKVVESWDEDAMQQIKQDKLNIPKEKLLQNELKI